MSDVGKDAVGRIQAKQSRTRGKHGGRTADERQERLELGRRAARNLIAGTIAKNKAKADRAAGITRRSN